MADKWQSLTDREIAVARLVEAAFTNQQIAHRLSLSPHTVNFHLRRIFGKLGINNRVQLAHVVGQQPPRRSTAAAE
jgi:DNA-binding CsgD family transcriptional regulator